MKTKTKTKTSQDRIKDQFEIFYEDILSKFSKISISPSIQYRNQGLYARESIDKNQVLIRKSLHTSITYDTIPLSFKNVFSLQKTNLSPQPQLIYNSQLRSYTQKSNKVLSNIRQNELSMDEKVISNILKNELNMDEKDLVLVLFLVFLVLLNKKVNKNSDSLLNESIKEEKGVTQTGNSERRIFSEWIESGSRTHGFGLFDCEQIMRSEDENLIIEYHAYKNGVRNFTQQLVDFIKLCCIDTKTSSQISEVPINQVTDISPQQSVGPFNQVININHQCVIDSEAQCCIIDEVSLGLSEEMLIREVFCQMLYQEKELGVVIFECLEIKNTRSFGYTEQTQLIPYVDYLNHSSKENVSLKFISQKELNQQQQQQQAITLSMTNIIQQNNIQEELTQLQSKNITIKQNLESIEQSQDSLYQLTSDDDSQDQIPKKNIYERASEDQLCLRVQEDVSMESPQWIIVRSTREISKGEELFLNYGNRNNLYLLKWYGFVEENNICDSLKVYVDKYEERVFYDPIQRTTQPFSFKWNHYVNNYQKNINLKNILFPQSEETKTGQEDLTWNDLVGKDQPSLVKQAEVVDKKYGNSLYIFQSPNQPSSSSSFPDIQRNNNHTQSNTYQRTTINNKSQEQRLNQTKDVQINLSGANSQTKTYSIQTNQNQLFNLKKITKFNQQLSDKVERLIKILHHFSAKKSSAEILRMIQFHKLKNFKSTSNSKNNPLKPKTIDNCHINLDFQLFTIRKILLQFQNPINLPPYYLKMKNHKSNPIRINEFIHQQPKKNQLPAEIGQIEFTGVDWIQKYHQIQADILQYVVWNISVCQQVLTAFQLLVHNMREIHKQLIQEGETQVNFQGMQRKLLNLIALKRKDSSQKSNTLINYLRQIQQDILNSLRSLFDTI